MTNHPNRSKTPYVVTGFDQVAKFSSLHRAFEYARMLSESGFLIEVCDKTGIIGQFRCSKATPEFAHLDDYDYGCGVAA